MSKQGQTLNNNMVTYNVGVCLHSRGNKLSSFISIQVICHKFQTFYHVIYLTYVFRYIYAHI